MSYSGDFNQSVSGSPLPATEEEEEQSEHFDNASHLTTPISRRSKRTSVATTVSDSIHEWFDALDGAEEFFMEAPITDGSEPPSRMLTNESRSSLVQQETSSIDTDIEEDHHVPHPYKIATSPAHSISQTTALEPRRTRLPAMPVGDEGSLFAILKKNVGKVRLFNSKHEPTFTMRIYRTYLRSHSPLPSTNL